jgi:hypothetical protein
MPVNPQYEGRHHRTPRIGLQTHRQGHLVVFNARLGVFLRMTPAPTQKGSHGQTMHPMWTVKIAPRMRRTKHERRRQ